jgi:3-methylcrotonyl-CoA carboxylase alpha subunit
LYAEDPERDFLPSTGVLRHLRFPTASGHVRVDTGVREGDSVTVHYDPMIAKLIVWDVDRDACLRRLRVALAATSVAGLTTNLDFLAAVADHPAFAALPGRARPCRDDAALVATVGELLRDVSRRQARRRTQR